MTQCCIFDLDGVIVDTAKYHYQAWRTIAQDLGFEFTTEDNERLKGVSRMTSLEILLSIGGIEMNEEDKKILAERKNEIYLQYIMKMGPEEILPGVKEFISILKKENIKVALGSASKNAVTILERLGINNLFDAIADGNNVSKAKPDPEVFLKAAALTETISNQCIVFEDAKAGIEAARAGGFKCVGIGSKAVLNRADFVIEGFSNPQLIKSLIDNLDLKSSEN